MKYYFRVGNNRKAYLWDIIYLIPFAFFIFIYLFALFLGYRPTYDDILFLWFFIFPYLMAYYIKAKKSKSFVFVNYVVILILNLFIGGGTIPDIMNLVSLKSFGNYLWFMIIFGLFILKNIKDSVPKFPKIEEINSINTDTIKTKGNFYMNFSELEKLSGINFQNYIIKAFNNSGILCKPSNMKNIDCIVDSKYALVVNATTVSIPLKVVENLFLNVNSSGFRLVIISKLPYDALVVDFSKSKGIELLIEEDLKYFDNYFYVPKYGNFGNSLFSSIQKKILKY